MNKWDQAKNHYPYLKVIFINFQPNPFSLIASYSLHMYTLNIYIYIYILINISSNIIKILLFSRKREKKVRKKKKEKKETKIRDGQVNRKHRPSDWDTCALDMIFFGIK